MARKGSFTHVTFRGSGDVQTQGASGVLTVRILFGPASCSRNWASAWVNIVTPHTIRHKTRGQVDEPTEAMREAGTRNRCHLVDE
jgi:hypothetical protein